MGLSKESHLLGDYRLQGDFCLNKGLNETDVSYVMPRRRITSSIAWRSIFRELGEWLLAVPIALALFAYKYLGQFLLPITTDPVTHKVQLHPLSLIVLIILANITGFTYYSYRKAMRSKEEEAPPSKSSDTSRNSSGNKR